MLLDREAAGAAPCQRQRPDKWAWSGSSGCALSPGGYSRDTSWEISCFFRKLRVRHSIGLRHSHRERGNNRI
jgi:hypothetical protein